MTEPSHDAAKLLTPTATYRKMVFAVLVGIPILGLLGWAANSIGSSGTGPSDGYELLSLTSGLIKEVIVKPGQEVQEGDVLVLLDDTAEQRELADARAELERVAQESQSSGIAVAVPPPMAGLGGSIVTTGPLSGIPGRFAHLPMGTENGKVGTLPPVTGAGDTPPIVPGEKPKVDLASVVANLESQLDSTRASIIENKQKADDASAQLLEAQKNVEAAQVIADQRKKQAERMRMLLGEGAVSQVETSRSEALAASAQGGYEAAVKQVEELRATHDTMVAEVSKGESAATKLEKEIATTKEAAEKIAAAPTPRQATDEPPVPSSTPSVSKPAFVKVAPAPAVPAKVTVDKGAKMEADSQLAAAKQRLDRAEQAVESCRIVATRPGTIIRVLVKAGDVLKAGSSIAVIRYAAKAAK